jgi:hypothetical protein
MTERRAKEHLDDSDDWEVVHDVAIRRPLAMVVSVRFSAAQADKVRRGASALKLTLSEFVRRAALTSAQAPGTLRDAAPPGVPRHIVLAGGFEGKVTGNVTWRADASDPVRIGQSTVGGASSPSELVFAGSSIGPTGGLTH